MKIMTLWVLLITGLFLSVGAQAQPTLKIGVVGGMTGPGAPWGLAVDGGVKVAAQEVNDAGGLNVGDENYKIKVITYDDHYKAADAVTATKRLIGRDGVKYIIGPIGSASVLAMKPITEEHKIVMLSDSYSTKVLDTNTKYMFRVVPTTNEYNRQLISWLKKNKPQLSSLAIISPNDATGWNTQKVQKKAYKDFGFDLVASKFFERSQSDFRALLVSILAKNPDFIELDTVPPGQAGVMIRQAREMGFQGQFTKFGGNNVADTVESAGKENAEGTLVYLSSDPDSPEHKKLEKGYAKFHDNSMDDFTFYFYDAANLLFDAIKRAGSVTNTDAVVAQIESHSSYEGIQGKIVWGGLETYGVDHQITAPAYLGVIKDGQAEIIKKFEAH